MQTQAAETRKKWTLLALATALVAILGFIGDWYGRTDMSDVYPSDAVSYLDVARAFGRGDWKAALNPLWNQGYPALVALVRPLFPAGPEGVWYATHTLNLALFLIAWLAFAWLVRELIVLRRNDENDTRGAGPILGFGALCLFLTAQLCMDQVSRVGPDKLVAVFFFASSALLIKLLGRPNWTLAALLGLAMGLGFLAKSAFLPLGCVVLAVLAWKLWKSRSSLRYLLPTALIFGTIVLTYGAALSNATGYRTLGESGSLNYAWHVNRLAKWVHWEGGADPADKAWPSARMAKFTHWQDAPPDFGAPLHPPRPVEAGPGGTPPTLYEFKADRHATYDPYYDPPYWYHGYKHIVNWRYQLIALAKNTGHLAVALAIQPMFWALGLVALLVLWRREARVEFAGWLRLTWPLAVCAAIGALIYVPVHLEDRYISSFLAVLALLVLVGVGPLVKREPLVLAILALGFAVGLVRNQRGGWDDMLHGRVHEDNVKWKIGMAVRDAGLKRGAEIGMISWGANLDTDWANIGEVEITSEIQSGPDEAVFVSLDEPAKAQVYQEFRRMGETAVLTRDAVVGRLPGWQQLGTAPVWIYRL